MFFLWWLARPVERGLWRGGQQPWGYSCPGVSRDPTDPFPKIKDVGSCLEAGESFEELVRADGDAQSWMWRTLLPPTSCSQWRTLLPPSPCSQFLSCL